MATRNDNTQVVIDDRFYVPPGMIDVRQSGSSSDSGYYGPQDLTGDIQVVAPPAPTLPTPPTSFQVVEQHVRVSSDGRAVVDLYLEFPDDEGVESIDVRVTKV